MAVLAVAAMVVAMTPRIGERSGCVELDDHTDHDPSRGRAARDSVGGFDGTLDGTLDGACTTAAQTALATSFVAFPHAITPGPQLDVDGTQVADAAPDGDDTVYMRTEAVTYQLTWDLAQLMVVPDGSVIFDAEGELVARVSEGALLSLVDG